MSRVCVCVCVCPLPPNYTSSTFVLGNEEQSRNQIQTVIPSWGLGGETLTCFSLKRKTVLFFVGCLETERFPASATALPRQEDYLSAELAEPLFITCQD